MSRLLHQLYNWLLFAGTMFFAAGASAVADAGAGGGAGGGGGEGSAGGDAGGDAGTGGGEGSSDAGDGSTGDAANQGGDGASASGEAGDRSDPNAPVDLGDGRTVPAKWKKLFDSVEDKALQKEVRQLFFANQRLAQKFAGGVNAAIDMANQLEEIGGFEAVQEMQSDLETYHADADLFLNNPAKWIETSFAEDVDASLKAFTASLDYVSQKHPEHYDHLLGKVVANTLDQAFPVQEIYKLLAGMKDNREALQLASQLARAYNNVRELADKVPAKQPDAERAKIDAERQTIASEKEALRNDKVNSQTLPYLGRQMTTHIERLAKDAGLDLKKFLAEQPETAKSMRSTILQQVMAKAAADKVFLKNYKAVMNQGDTQRAIAMMNKKHMEILPEIVRSVARGFGIVKKAGAGARGGQGGGAGSGARGAAPGGNAGKGYQRVSEKPHGAAIDWNNPGTDIYESKAVLKDGRKVTWA